MPMAGPLRTRGNSEERWERGLYLLLLIVAIVVIVYSLFGIATLLGYLPLNQGGGPSKQVQHPAVEAVPSFGRIKDSPAAREGGDVACVQRIRANMDPARPKQRIRTSTEKARSECAEIEAYQLLPNTILVSRKAERE
jgi:hypothetical protein